MQTWRGRPYLERGNMELAVTMWQGWLDSNQRMRESKSLALPLGYTPVYWGMAGAGAEAPALPPLMWGG